MSNVLIVLGAGDIGMRVCEDVLSVLTIYYDEIFFYDNNVEKQGMYIENYSILSLNELLEKKEKQNVSIIIATDCWQELCEFCKKHDLYQNIIAIYNRTTLLPNAFYKKGYSRQGYAQDGEDLWLQEQEVWRSDSNGFYIDIGANHPIYGSTTWLAYQRGWSGINIEPNEEFIPLFNKLRERDVNINCGIAETEGVLDYYKFEDSVYNTFEKEEFAGTGRMPKEIKKVPVYRLEKILEENNVRDITFLSVDVEGLELSVLKSNDWDRWRPRYIMVEQKNVSVEELICSDIYRFLKSMNYKCDYLCVRTAIYKSTE